MLTNNRDAYRQAFFIAWQKYQKKDLLEPLELQLVEIILLHPEYHTLLEKPAMYQSQSFPLEENPFFHMSLHLALREQLRTNRPFGITQIYQALLHQYTHPHEAEHHMMATLAAIMEKAQQTGELPSDELYLQQLRKSISFLTPDPATSAG